jgi:hypothetical protein
MRWITLSGRIGTVILAIGLALLVAWLIPSGVNYKSGWAGSIEPEQYEAGESQVWSPQNGLQISVEAAGDVRVYLLGVKSPQLDNWRASLREAYADPEDPSLQMFIEFYTLPLLFFHEAYPEQTLKGEDLYNPQTRGMVWNVTVLDNGLETHPEIILWDPPAGSTFSHELFPEDILSIVAVVANPASDTVEVDLEIKEVTAVAPKDRIIFPAILLMSLGFGLTIGWLVSRSKEKFDKALSDRR